MRLNSDTGELSGTPTISGTLKKAKNFSFKISATNIYGNHKVSFNLTISPAASSASAVEDVKEAVDDNAEAVTPDVQNGTNELESYSVIEIPENLGNSGGSVSRENSGASLHVIGDDGEPANEIVNISSGQDLLFELGAWFNSEGHEVDVSGAKVYVNDEAVEVEIYDDGTFVLDAGEAGDGIKVYVKALSPSGEELKSDEVCIIIE